MKFVPMSKSRYAAFERASIEGYAQSNVESGRWDESDAMARAASAHHELLPNGLNTEHHHLFDLCADGEKVGMLWVYTEPETEVASAYIYDIEIESEHRGRGLGKEAMRALEDWCHERNVKRIELNVFAFNKTAIRLYEGLDYQATNFKMQKDL